MSTETPGTGSTTTTADLLRLPRPSALRLVGVELRKSLDTRASRWFVAALALLVVAAAFYSLLGGSTDEPITAVSVFTTSWDVVRMLVPVLGVLSMTSEWSQRTASATFALVPRRGRVLAAKLGALLVISVVMVVFTGLVAVAVTAVAGPLTGLPVHWSGLVRHVGGALVGAICFMALGVGFGVLLQQTAAALVAYFLAPTLTTLVGMSLLGDRAEWIAPTVAISRIEDLDVSGSVAPTVVALALWVVLPLTAGAVRWLRREVS